jgi:5-methylcytosine-specific restriction endonuclease McrA
MGCKWRNRLPTAIRCERRDGVPVRDPFGSGRLASHCAVQSRVAVDHVIPFMLMSCGWRDGDLHQVWNFVLACWACNSDKRDRPPAQEWMPWLVDRAEQLIGSHHPLRETLMRQLGNDANERYRTLARRYNEATTYLRPWKPPRLPDQ